MSLVSCPGGWPVAIFVWTGKFALVQDHKARFLEIMNNKNVTKHLKQEKNEQDRKQVTSWETN